MKFLLWIGSVAINCVRYVFSEKWFRKKIVRGIVKRKNRKNLIDSYNLSAHLMNDLGFDRDGKPVQWATFSKPPQMSYEAHPVKAKKTYLCVAERDDKHLALQSGV